MKLKIMETEIEATATDLKACNTLSDGFSNILRGIFNPPTYEYEDDCEEGEDEE